MKKRLGEFLLERGLLTQEQLTDALTLQRRNGIRLGAALMVRELLTETQLVEALGELLQIRVIPLRSIEPDAAALKMVSRDFASEHDLVPVEVKVERGRSTLTVAMSDPLDVRAIDELGFMTNSIVAPVIARASDIDMMIRRCYGPRFLQSQQHRQSGPLRLESEPPTEMLILRRGGGEELVNTQTGPLPTLATLAGKPAENADIENAPVKIPPEAVRAPGTETSAVLLTDEVPLNTPVDSLTDDMAAGTEAAPIPLTAVKRAPAKASPPPIPAPDPDPPPRAVPPPPPGADHAAFNQQLGVLIDAAGESVNAESVLRLERRFWALMRVLAKKGVLTNEDFLAELREEGVWR